MEIPSTRGSPERLCVFCGQYVGNNLNLTRTGICQNCHLPNPNGVKGVDDGVCKRLSITKPKEFMLNKEVRVGGEDI